MLFGLIIGICLGISITYIGIVMQVALFHIPIKIIQGVYYKLASKAFEKVSDAKFEADLKKAEYDVLRKRNKK